MRGMLNIRMLSVRAALLAVLVAGLMLPGAQAQSANQNQKSDKQASSSSHAQAPSASSKAAEEESAPTNKEHTGGPQEGIKIHGHWVIDVRNPDGKLVTHREFENSYLDTNFLSIILARQNSVGLWEVLLSGLGGTYTIGEPAQPGSIISKNLTISPSHDSVVLIGSWTAVDTADIRVVETAVAECPPSVAPATPCTDGFSNGFTSTALSPPISFVLGQIVQVTVTISFS
jgi:hypothetical protein